MDWITLIRKFPGTGVSMVHLKIAITLKGCIWDLEDENKAVLMFSILPAFKILFLRLVRLLTFLFLFFCFMS